LEHALPLFLTAVLRKPPYKEYLRVITFDLNTCLIFNKKYNTFARKGDVEVRYLKKKYISFHRNKRREIVRRRRRRKRGKGKELLGYAKHVLSAKSINTRPPVVPLVRNTFPQRKHPATLPSVLFADTPPALVKW
jgi:hypothetical protein